MYRNITETHSGLNEFAMEPRQRNGVCEARFKLEADQHVCSPVPLNRNVFDCGPRDQVIGSEEVFEPLRRYRKSRAISYERFHEDLTRCAQVQERPGKYDGHKKRHYTLADAAG